MKNTYIASGFLSGFYSSTGLLPHLIFLAVLLISDRPGPLEFLITFTVAAKLLGEWLFWKTWKARMDTVIGHSDWEIKLDQSVISYPNVLVSLFVILIDLSIDIVLIYAALKTSLPAVGIFLLLLGCQALSSSFQGYFSDRYSQKKSLLFALVIGWIAVIFCLPLYGIETPLAKLPPSTLIVLVLCLKGCLGNSTVIARSAIADVLKRETIERVKKA